MEYILITILQMIGVGFQVGQKALELDKRFPDDTLSDIFKEMWRDDKITLLISGLIIFTNLVVHFIVLQYTDLEAIIPYYPLYNFGLAIVLGYGGQRIVYKYLGKAESVLLKKADKLDDL